jgi:hypothetical protein
MTGLAQCDEVIPVMGATLGERQLVMDFLGRNVLPFGKALLTQRMGGGIGITDAFPCSAVAFLYSGVTVVLLVAFVFLFLMFLAEPTVRKIGTAGERTRSLWFSWHPFHLLGA